MDITLKTDEVWQLDFDFDPLAFLSAASALLKEGDVALFGAYEPTSELVSALRAVGAIPHSHLPEFLTAFDMNRREHPHGSAFEYRIGSFGFSEILHLDRTILRQTDIESFYDHFIAYRPGKEANKAPEPTPMSVTPRAPSSTSRASHRRGSSLTLGEKEHAYAHRA